MDDTQTLMNGFMRMAVDNAVLSGNLIVEVDETNLVPGQDLSLYPGKVFRRQGGAPGQAIFGTKFPNVSGENMQLFDKARQLSDESTGMPSYAHGMTGVQGVGRLLLVCLCCYRPLVRILRQLFVILMITYLPQ